MPPSRSQPRARAVTKSVGERGRPAEKGQPVRNCLPVDPGRPSNTGAVGRFARKSTRISADHSRIRLQSQIGRSRAAPGPATLAGRPRSSQAAGGCAAGARARSPNRRLKSSGRASWAAAWALPRTLRRPFRARITRQPKPTALRTAASTRLPVSPPGRAAAFLRRPAQVRAEPSQGEWTGLPIVSAGGRNRFRSGTLRSLPDPAALRVMSGPSWRRRRQASRPSPSASRG